MEKQQKKINLKSIYFADSVGCLFPRDVKDIVERMKTSFEGDVGIHAHNNLGLAFINSVSAIEAGATWVDGTLTGMGRGPGNTLTEDMFINYFQNKNTNYSDLIEFNSKYLDKLKYEKNGEATLSISWQGKIKFTHHIYKKCFMMIVSILLI